MLKNLKSRRYPADEGVANNLALTDEGVANNLALLADTPAKAESLLYNLEKTARAI